MTHAYVLTLVIFTLASHAEASFFRRATIADRVVQDGRLSILADALERANLVATLDGSGPFTVFAPNDHAFLNLLDQLGLSSLDEVPVDVLTDILLDHVVQARLSARTLIRSDRRDQDEFALGELRLEFDRHPLQVNDIDVVDADIRASNGIIHIIDEVLIDPDPRPSITELALSTPELSILVEAVSRTGLDLVLSNGGPFTVFAPTNQAFLDLLMSLGLSGLDEVDDRTLTNILLDHVVALELDAIDVVERAKTGRRVRALGRLRLDFERHPLTVNGIDIIVTDVEAENGTVHVIDEVLLDPRN